MPHSSVVSANRDLNVIEVDGKQFLLTATAGDATHLTRKADRVKRGQAAVPEHYVEDFEHIYDIAAILEPKWAATTLCGREWILMEGERDGQDADEARYAPTCRRCLALLDKLFPAPKLNDRFPLIVQIISDIVLEHGTAEILGVPGDQQAALRKEVRAEIKKRTGHGLTTHAHESMVIFVCDPIYDLHADEHTRRGAEAVDAFLSGKEVSHQSPTRLWWRTWAAE
jgi:hypothetical protein